MSQPSQPISADNAVQMLTEDEDDVYFGSYAHFSIHQEMLKVCTSKYNDKSAWVTSNLETGKLFLNTSTVCISVKLLTVLSVKLDNLTILKTVVVILNLP